MSAVEKQNLIEDYSKNRLTTLLPSASIIYFREFTVGHNIRKQIDSVTKAYLIVGLDGALRLTNGQTTEELMFPQDGGIADTQRWLAVPLPAHWQTLSQTSLVVEELP